MKKDIPRVTPRDFEVLDDVEIRLKAIRERILARSRRLDAVESKVLYDNLWDFYLRDDE